MRNKRLVILLTDKEKETLEKLAKEKNTTISLLVRKIIFSGL